MQLDSLRFRIQTDKKSDKHLAGVGIVLDGSVITAENGWKEANFVMSKVEIQKTIEMLEELLEIN